MLRKNIRVSDECSGVMMTKKVSVKDYNGERVSSLAELSVGGEIRKCQNLISISTNIVMAALVSR